MIILVEVDEAQERMEELISLARRGDDVVITKDHQPGCRLRPISDEEAKQIKAQMQDLARNEEKEQSGGAGA